MDTEQIKKINDLLEKGEPGNISEDTYTKYTGYSPQYIVDAVNFVLGVEGWGFEEISNTLTDKGENGKPQIAIAKVMVWLGQPETNRIAYGEGRVTRGSYGDAQKSAQTDALKKAFSYFSIGAKAYRGQL